MSGFVSRSARAFIIGSAIIIGCGLLVQNVSAAFDSFLQIDGIKGESKDDKHKDWIQLESFSWGSSRASSMGSATREGGAGRVALHDFMITKRLDASSAQLAQIMSAGQHIPKMVLDVGGRLYTFEDAMITSVKMEGEREAITIAYARVTMAPGARHPVQDMGSVHEMQQPH